MQAEIEELYYKSEKNQIKLNEAIQKNLENFDNTFFFLLKISIVFIAIVGSYINCSYSTFMVNTYPDCIDDKVLNFLNLINFYLTQRPIVKLILQLSDFIMLNIVATLIAIKFIYVKKSYSLIVKLMIIIVFRLISISMYIPHWPKNQINYDYQYFFEIGNSHHSQTFFSWTTSICTLGIIYFRKEKKIYSYFSFATLLLDSFIKMTLQTIYCIDVIFAIIVGIYVNFISKKIMNEFDKQEISDLKIDL